MKQEVSTTTDLRANLLTNLLIDLKGRGVGEILKMEEYYTRWKSTITV